ncbi:hypothetical protein [Streptomyces sp. NPDC047009]|uniref:hypothetical protein n=1 Tax=Streptomyces sp. NPDC047009 TaxID=3154496 RepID=UPI003401ED4B
MAQFGRVVGLWLAPGAEVAWLFAPGVAVWVLLPWLGVAVGVAPAVGWAAEDAGAGVVLAAGRAEVEPVPGWVAAPGPVAVVPGPVLWAAAPLPAVPCGARAGALGGAVPADP